MILVKATITAKPGDRDKIISRSQDVIGPTRSELGCISYELFASTEDKDVLIMFEQWENREVLESTCKRNISKHLVQPSKIL